MDGEGEPPLVHAIFDPQLDGLGTGAYHLSVLSLDESHRKIREFLECGLAQIQVIHISTTPSLVPDHWTLIGGFHHHACPTGSLDLEACSADLRMIEQIRVGSTDLSERESVRRDGLVPARAFINPHVPCGSSRLPVGQGSQGGLGNRDSNKNS